MKRPVRLDRDGDGHFDVASAFIKSMRGSDPDAAIYWLAVMIAGGEDPKFIARRVIVFASEDVGNADPARARDRRRPRPARSSSSACRRRASTSPRRSPTWRWRRSRTRRSRPSTPPWRRCGGRGNLTPPASIRDGHYPGARALGRGAGYVYPHAHGGFEPTQRYLPDELGDTRFYEPSANGFEARLTELLDDLRRRREEAAR